MRVTMENQPGEHPGLTDERADLSGFHEPAAVIIERRLQALEAAADARSAFDIAVRKVLEKSNPRFGQMLRIAIMDVEMARTTAALDAQAGKL
jgi:hypothetical protein